MRLQIYTPRLFILVSLISFPLWTSACGGEEDADVRTYEVRGVLVGTQYNGQAAVINHERIPGYMDAMQMALRVGEAETLAGIEPGAKIQFDLVVTDEEAYIENIEPLPDSTALNLAASPVLDGRSEVDTTATQ